MMSASASVLFIFIAALFIRDEDIAQVFKKTEKTCLNYLLMLIYSVSVGIMFHHVRFLLTQYHEQCMTNFHQT